MNETLSQEAKRLSENTKNEHYKITSYCLERCAREIEALRGVVRTLAIVQHVRLTYGGGDTPSGGSCRVCKSEWSENEAEKHAVACSAAITSGERG